MLLWFTSAWALTLEQAWQAADQDSNEMILIDESQRQAELYRLQAWASLSPRIVLNGNWTLNQREVALDFSQSFPTEVLDMIEQFTGAPVDFGEPTVIQEKSYFDANLTVVQPILNARAFPGLIGAYAQARAGSAQADAARAQLRVGVARAYWGVMVARQAESVSTEALALAKKHAETANKLVDAGSAPPQTRLQAEIAVARAERDLLGAEARRVQAEESFIALTNLSVEGVFDEPSVPPLPYTDVEAAVQRALSHRPDVVAASQQAKATHAIATASGLGWVPTLDARFTQAWTENTGFSGENTTWMFVLAASWTLWDGGYRLVENERTASQARQADAAADKAVEDTTVLVRTAWKDRERALAALSTAERELALAEENLRLAEVSYRAGASAFLDLEDARIGRDAAKMSVISERMNVAIAALTLLGQTGDL